MDRVDVSSSMAQVKQLFLDLDGTLVHLNRKGGTHHGGGDSYLLLHGCKEFLLSLSGVPGMNINFFSFGPENRNRELVADLVRDVPSLKHYRVFSQEHMYHVDHSFTVQKRLRDFSGVDMEETIMVDDRAADVCAQGEERNCLPVYSGEFQFDGAGLTYPRGVFEMRRENSLVRVLGMILWCLKTSSESNISLVEALTQLQWDSATSTYRHRETNSRKIYSLGLAAMRGFNPEFDLVDKEHKGYLPWSPPLAALNPHSQVRLLVWYQHFGYDEEQVRTILTFPLSESSDELLPAGEEAEKLVTVEILGGLYVNLPAGLSGDVIKDVVKDVVAYGMDGHDNVELVEKAPGILKLALRKIRLCDFDSRSGSQQKEQNNLGSEIFFS